jgi:hypothetical protein
MDIDEMVRRSRPGSSAGWARSEAGLRVLEAVTAAEPGVNRPARAPRWSFIGAGLVGATAAAVLVTSALVSTGQEPGGDAPPGAGGVPGATAGRDGGATPVTARDILLAAATRAERAPAENGRYWHVKTVEVFGPVRVGGESNGYLVSRSSIAESWDAREPGEASWTGERILGARPRGAADEKAWRAAGSPAEWRIDSDGQQVVLSTKPGRGDLAREPGQPRYLEDLGRLTLAQVRELPTGQRALRDWVTSRVRQDGEFTPGTPEGDLWLFGTLSRLLLDTPAAPGVRASAFRILADIPGVTNLGTVRDENGRSGLGIEYVNRTETQRLIIDADTQLVLASRISSNPERTKVPAKESSTLVLTAEWSDAAPEVPSLP